MPSTSRTTSRTLFGVQIQIKTFNKRKQSFSSSSSSRSDADEDQHNNPHPHHHKKSVSFQIVPTKVTVIPNRHSDEQQYGTKLSSSSIPIALLSTSNLVSLLNFYHRQRQIRKQQQK